MAWRRSGARSRFCLSDSARQAIIALQLTPPGEEASAALFIQNIEREIGNYLQTDPRRKDMEASLTEWQASEIGQAHARQEKRLEILEKLFDEAERTMRDYWAEFDQWGNLAGPLSPRLGKGLAQHFLAARPNSIARSALAIDAFDMGLAAVVKLKQGSRDAQLAKPPPKKKHRPVDPMLKLVHGLAYAVYESGCFDTPRWEKHVDMPAAPQGPIVLLLGIIREAMKLPALKNPAKHVRDYLARQDEDLAREEEWDRLLELHNEQKCSHKTCQFCSYKNGDWREINANRQSRFSISEGGDE